jgi:hypothetical protein
VVAVECKLDDLSVYCDALQIRVRVLAGMLVDVSKAIGRAPDLDRILNDTIELLGKDPRRPAARASRATRPAAREANKEGA